MQVKVSRRILQKGFTIEVDDAYDVSLSIGCEKTVHLPYYEMPDYHASQRSRQQSSARRQAM